jgi:DNA polymerase V
MEEPLTAKKMIATTRMFGRDASTIIEIKEAIATYTARAAEKLRRQECVARTIEIFVVQKDAHIEGKRFRHGHKVSTYTNLQVASADTTVLSAAATALVNQLFVPGQKYKKVGVMLSGIEPAGEVQSNLFATEDAKNNDALMQTIDNINFAMRDDAVKLAASGTTRNWKMRSELRSPRYTTRWEELAVVS